jgi:Na+/proline symporter
MFIPLSSIMFPHIAIMCLTAEKIGHFKKTIIFYPICIALIWLPSVYLGVVAASQYPGLTSGEANDVIIRLLRDNTGVLVSGILGAGIMACVMASDSQILALSTMFTEDLFAYYGGRKRFGQQAEVWAGRAFIVLIGVVAYLIALALKDKAGIFELAIRFAFSGFAALAPIMLAALFWKRSNKWGALAAALWVAGCVLGTAYVTRVSDPIAPRPPAPRRVAAGDAPAAAAPPRPTRPAPPVQVYPALGDLFLRGPTSVTMYGYLPVFPMVVGSALLMALVSLLTPPPSRATLDKYFPRTTASGSENV